jgi:hypothetical protein
MAHRLMGTHATVARLPEIALHAEHLKAGRIPLALQVPVQIATISPSAVCSSIIVDVIQR